MSTRSSATHAQSRPWLKPRVVGGVITILVPGAAVLDTAFVRAGAQAVPADTAAEYAELNYESVVVPTIVDSAQPLDELLAAIVADPDAAGEEFGKREDATKPYSFATTATGVVAEGKFGEVGLDVPGLPEGLTVGVAIPPLGSAAAVRDAGTELSFGDFVNQTEYQRVALELNTRVVEGVFADLDLPGLVGEEITVVGAFAVHIAELAVEQADLFIRTGDTGQPEKQSIDCVLIDASNVDRYTLFALES